MPIFEFICTQCNFKFEKIQSKHDPMPTCPKCQSTKTQKAISTFGFVGANGGKSSASLGGCSSCSSGSCSTCSC